MRLDNTFISEIILRCLKRKKEIKASHLFNRFKTNQFAFGNKIL
jgi:hypothetical protein